MNTNNNLLNDSYHHMPKLSDKTQMRTAQDVSDDLSFFEYHLHPFAYVLLLQN